MSHDSQRSLGHKMILIKSSKCSELMFVLCRAELRSGAMFIACLAMKSHYNHKMQTDLLRWNVETKRSDKLTVVTHSVLVFFFPFPLLIAHRIGDMNYMTIEGD